MIKTRLLSRAVPCGQQFAQNRDCWWSHFNFWFPKTPLTMDYKQTGGIERIFFGTTHTPGEGEKFFWGKRWKNPFFRPLQQTHFQCHSFSPPPAGGDNNTQEEGLTFGGGLSTTPRCAVKKKGRRKRGGGLEIRPQREETGGVVLRILGHFQGFCIPMWGGSPDPRRTASSGSEADRAVGCGPVARPTRIFGLR